MKAEIAKYDLTGAIIDLVRGEPGITAVQAAKRLEVDKRTVIGRARDSDLLEMTGGKRGAGHAYRLYLSDNGAS
jgi:predicted DNA-binding transcriptional regulator YafY